MDRIIKMKELPGITGRSRASLWRDIKAGKFPKPVRLGTNSVGFKASEIQNWLDGLK